MLWTSIAGRNDVTLETGLRKQWIIRKNLVWEPFHRMSISRMRYSSRSIQINRKQLNLLAYMWSTKLVWKTYWSPLYRKLSRFLAGVHRFWNVISSQFFPSSNSETFSYFSASVLSVEVWTSEGTVLSGVLLWKSAFSSAIFDTNAASLPA